MQVSIATRLCLSAAVWMFAIRCDAQTIEITGGDHETRGAVIRVALPPDTAIERAELNDGSRAALVASVIDGELIAVIPNLSAHETRRYTIDPVQNARQRGVRVAEGRQDHTVDVMLGRELWTRYHFSPDQRKPYLWPLNGEAEVGLTRDYPMGERVKSIDHPHHESFWSSYGHLNGADFWEYSERTGWQTSETVTWGGAGAMAWIRADNVWVDAQRAPVIYETREYRFYPGPEGRRILDLEVTLSARYGAVHFQDTKEGGLLAYRIHDDLRERGGTGRIANSEGGAGAAECWGKPARWVHYQGTVEGAGEYGILAMDHPESFRHPSYWHARDYGLVAANPFGLSDFTDGALNGDYALADNESITFRYRVLLHAGSLGAAEAEAYYRGFASPPRAEIVESP